MDRDRNAVLLLPEVAVAICLTLQGYLLQIQPLVLCFPWGHLLSFFLSLVQQDLLVIWSGLLQTWNPQPPKFAILVFIVSLA